MYRIAVCDGRSEDVEVLRGFISDYFGRVGLNYTLSSFASGESVLEELTSDIVYDVYIIDVLLPGMDGMELAMAIRGKDRTCAIIFLTGSANYAVHGYSVKALDYCLKPATQAMVDAVLSRVVAMHTHSRKVVIKLKDRSAYKELEVFRIIYVMSERYTIFFYVQDGSIEQMTISLDDYETYLTKYRFFLRCHKSYLVNMNFVKSMDQDRFLLRNGEAIAISRRYREVCREKYSRFLSDRMNQS